MDVRPVGPIVLSRFVRAWLGVAVAVAVGPHAAQAEQWTFYRSGPFEVYTARDQKHARATLNHLEQLRFAFGYFTGKTEAKTLWPVRLISGREPSSPRLERINDSFRARLNEKADVPPAWNEELLAVLIADNLGRMPAEIEAGLIAVLSTAEVSGTHIIIGQPPGQPDLNWARMHYLMTSEEYRGRVRVFLANLERGIEWDVALRNSISRTKVQIEEEARRHLESKTVATFDLPGKPVNADRDFAPRVPDEDRLRALLATAHQPGSAMGLAAAGQWEAASKVQPEWSEPWYQLSRTETDAARKGGLLKKAAELAPRNASLWTEFATLMTSYERWTDADKAWAQALKAAESPAAREAIQQRRRDMAEQRAAAEEEAKRQAKLSAEREIQQLKNEAVARIRMAEAKANEAQPPRDPSAKVVEWWDGPKTDATVKGLLRRVDCAGKRLTLVIDRPGEPKGPGQTLTLTVPDPTRVTIEGASGAATLSCGIQRPARVIEVDYFQQSREAAVIRLP